MMGMGGFTKEYSRKVLRSATITRARVAGDRGMQCRSCQISEVSTPRGPTAEGWALALGDSKWLRRNRRPGFSTKV